MGLSCVACAPKTSDSNLVQLSKDAKEIRNSIAKSDEKILAGADQTELYISKLVGKKVVVVGNQTSVIGQSHLVDSLQKLGINIVKAFSPEHGFRGVADAGEKVNSSVDSKTGIPIVSLYGSNKKPTQEQLKGVEIIVFDVQDVGVRFYTYISTLHYVMEAAAEAKIPVIILDRPNPNGHYVDGPVLESAYKSFIGMHKVPVVYGMTIGEYGQMINGEGWLSGSLVCDLSVIPLKNYTHQSSYSLSIAPSPNLKTDEAINLYPSLCLFEGTVVSVGRGTETPFEIYGHPDFPKTDFSFTPKPMEGAKSPLLMNKLCNGYNLHQSKNLASFNLEYIIQANKLLGSEKLFSNSKFFNLLAGNSVLIEQIKKKVPESEIRKSWEKGLAEFELVREKYLIYE